MNSQLPHYVLTLACDDRRGIVNAVSRFLTDRGCNIEEAAQFSEQETKRFFMRVAFTMQEEAIELRDLQSQFDNVACDFGMEWRIRDLQLPMPTVIMVSKLGHCLHDLLLRWKTGLLPIEVKAIVSNHRDFYQLAASYDIPFHHVPVTPGTKPEAEAELLRIVEDEKAELVILARYMQVLSGDLCRQLQGRAINIHHSFLPGFKGAKPYYQAHARGVKLIGATAHFVTAELDEGPIIEQDVVRTNHSMSPAALTSLGRDVESLVLARAVKWQAEHRLLVHGSRTVVFS